MTAAAPTTPTGPTRARDARRTAGQSPAPVTARSGYRAALASEWTKFATIRSGPALAATVGAVFPLFAAVVAATGSLQDDDTILGASLLGGAVLAQVLAAVLGAVLVTNEFRTGLIRVTLTACPRRLTVLAAKATVAAGTTGAATLVGAATAYGIGTAMLDPDRYAPGQPWPALLGVAVAIAAISVLGVGVGTLTRSPSVAVTVLVAVVLVPDLVAPLLGDGQRWVGGASLSGVMQKLTQSSDATPDTVGSLGPWPSLAVVAGYTTAVLLAAAVVLRRRDT